MNQNAILLNVVESITNLPLTGQNLTPGSSPTFNNLLVTGNLTVNGTSTLVGLVTGNQIQATLIAADTLSAQTLTTGGDATVGGQLFVSGDITSSQNINNTDTVTSKYLHAQADVKADAGVISDTVSAATSVEAPTIHATNLLLSDNVTQTTTLQVGTILGLAAVLPINSGILQPSVGLRLPTLTGNDTNTTILTRNAGTNNVETRTYASINPLTTKGDLMTWATGPFSIRLAASATTGATLATDPTTASGLVWDTKELVSLYRLTITLPQITVNSGSTGDSQAVTLATGETHTVYVVTCMRNSVNFAQGFITGTLRFKNVGGTAILVGSSGISQATEGGVNGSTWTATVSGATYFLRYGASGGNPVNFSSTLYITRCI